MTAQLSGFRSGSNVTERMCLCLPVTQAGLPRCRLNFLVPCTYHENCTAIDIFDSCLFNVPDYTVARMALLWYTRIGRPGISVQANVRVL